MISLEEVVQQESVEDSCVVLLKEEIVKKVEDALKNALETLQQNPLKNFKGCTLSGSLAKGTAIKVDFDIDIVAFFRQGSRTAKDRVNHFGSEVQKCAQLWKKQGLVESSEILRNTARGVKLFWKHADAVHCVDLVVALEPAPASSGRLLSPSNTFVFGPTIQDECSTFISRQPQVVKDCVKLMKLYAVYEQWMSNNISPGGHQFRFPPGYALEIMVVWLYNQRPTSSLQELFSSFSEFGANLDLTQRIQISVKTGLDFYSSTATEDDSFIGPLAIDKPVPVQVLQPFTKQNLTHKLDADHWKYFRDACVRACQQLECLGHLLRLSTSSDSSLLQVQECEDWLASFDANMCDIPPMFAANTVTVLGPPDTIDDRRRPSLWGSLASYLHVPLLWAAEREVLGKGFTQGLAHKEASNNFWKSATEFWYLEDMLCIDGKPNVSKLSITGPLAASVEAAYKMLVYEALQRCQAKGFHPVRPNVARAVSILFHEVAWKQTRANNNAMEVDLQLPAELLHKKNLESCRLDELMAFFGVQIEMHDPPRRKGKLWQDEASKLHRMCQAVATFVSNDAILAVVGPCTFSTQGARNWAFCWMLEALFEVGQVAIPAVILGRMGLSKDDPTIVAMPENLPKWCKKYPLPDFCDQPFL